ncbi:ADP-dependent glucokinase-like [Lytechinus variegatus]|uniref:ADP-dependent glucokinase-like n=1 Tax=Lytechinus variegatus TaxID=7654 RepID=UPI001BB239DB|nr:ADP-dependent glucokinase-like [Lytechinus variegatus]
MFSNTLIVAVALIAISAYYSMKNLNQIGLSASVESQIAFSWGNVIAAGFSLQRVQGLRNMSRIAVGVNVNSDLIVSGTAVLKKLGIDPSGQAIDNSIIGSVNELEQTFSYSLKNGAAIERIFSTSGDFEKVVRAADSLDEKQYFVGGNAALAGLTMADTWRDLEVLLIGPCGPRVRALLPSNVIVPKPSYKETDEVHLIMEFKRNERWGVHQSKVATRFITSYDVSNTEMTALSEFARSVNDFSPDAVFFSGLHLLDGQPGEKKREKMAALNQELSRLPSDLPVHLELASMADPELIKGIYTQVLSSVHSLGLNEQELSFMSSVNSGPHPEVYIRDGYPEVGAVADILHWILSSTQQGTWLTKAEQPLAGWSSKLTRVHFHSLAFHIVATINNTWVNNAAAVSAGARHAGRQACDDGKIVDEKVELRIPKEFALSINYAPLRHRVVSIDPQDPVIAWTRDNIQFHFTPVLVCKNPVKTVGLGDAISSTGFLYSRMVSAS